MLIYTVESLLTDPVIVTSIFSALAKFDHIPENIADVVNRMSIIAACDKHWASSKELTLSGIKDYCFVSVIEQKENQHSCKSEEEKKLKCIASTYNKWRKI